MIRIAIVVAACSFSLAAVPAAAESPAEKLQRAIQAEEVQNDLDEAIAIYEELLASRQADRALSAEVGFRLGRCYARKGWTAEAGSVLSELVSSFPDQNEWVGKAKKELARLKQEDAPGPTVTQTTPAAFADDVPATLDKITVTFDQPMKDNAWSFTGGGDSFPKVVGVPKYDAQRRTCTLSVKLEPAKVYWVGINSPDNRNFVSEKGKPAAPYVILFATANAEGKPTPIPADMARDAKRVNDAHSRGGDSPTPRILATEPAAFSQNVPATLDKITVTFDRVMRDKTWSWTGGGETFPKVTGQPFYDSGRRTCTLPVKLEAGKVYWVGVNSSDFRNFMSQEGDAAPWHVILFATAGADGSSTPIPEDLLQRAKGINAQADR